MGLRAPYPDGTPGWTIGNALNSADPTLTGQQQVRLVSRSFNTITYPVPVFRPVTANTPMAFDFGPNGTGLNAANGYAWLDVMDADTLGSFTGDANNAVATARIAAQTDHVALESYANVFGNAKVLWIKTPQSATTRNPVVKFSKSTSGIRTADDQALTTDPSIVFSGGSVVASSGFRLPASATGGFLYIPAIAGAPSGVPTSYGKSVAVGFDPATNRCWFYNYVTPAWVSTLAA